MCNYGSVVLWHYVIMELSAANFHNGIFYNFTISQCGDEPWEREGDWRLPRKSENPVLQFAIAQAARILIKL